jgi:hypothetical protein
LAKPDIPERPTAYNYGICFLDLLGQRAVFRGEGWLPVTRTEDERKHFFDTKLNPTVGAVLELQRSAYSMISSVVDSHEDSPLRLQLSPEQRPAWDAMRRTKIKTQHWSDGRICYAALGDPEVKCRMNAIYALFAMAGVVMLQGLARRQPVRGAIDGAWAMEIQDGELYGPAIANAYELESVVAQWPRIVISDRMLQMLTDHQNEPGDNVFVGMDRELANLCLGMVGRDLDGVHILHYLGKHFSAAITKRVLPELYQAAMSFIDEQWSKFRTAGDAKLAGRYAHLRMYFEANAPTRASNGSAV